MKNSLTNNEILPVIWQWPICACWAWKYTGRTEVGRKMIQLVMLTACRKLSTWSIQHVWALWVSIMQAMIILHLTVGWLTEENCSIDPSLTVTNLLAALLWHKGFKSTLQLLKGTLNEQEQTTLHLLAVPVSQYGMNSCCSTALRPTYFQIGICMEAIYNDGHWLQEQIPNYWKA